MDPCLIDHEWVKTHTECSPEDLYPYLFMIANQREGFRYWLRGPICDMKLEDPKLSAVFEMEIPDKNQRKGVMKAFFKNLPTGYMPECNGNGCYTFPLVGPRQVVDTKDLPADVFGFELPEFELPGTYSFRPLYTRELDVAGYAYVNLTVDDTGPKPSPLFSQSTYPGMPVIRHTILVDPKDEPFLRGQAASPGVAHGRLCSTFETLDSPILVVSGEAGGSKIKMAKEALGLVIIGGTSSHLAVLARGWGIPAICVSARTFPLGKWITLDGSNGLAFVGVKDVYTESLVKGETFMQADKILSEAGIKVWANADTPDQVAQAKCDIGLVRTEHVIQNDDMLRADPGKLIMPDPLHQHGQLHTRMQEALGDLAVAAGDHQVVIRFCDAPSHEFGLPAETNPMMGMRGCRVYHPSSPAYTAVRRIADELPNVTALHPLIAAVPDLSLVNKGDAVMIETPAAVALMPYMKSIGVEKVSFGTNDLTQFYLGLSRDDCVQIVQQWEGAGEPNPFKVPITPICQAIYDAVQMFTQVTVCGNHAADPEGAKLLLEAGVTNFSVPAAEVEKVKLTLASSWSKDKESVVTVVPDITQPKGISLNTAAQILENI